MSTSVITDIHCDSCSAWSEALRVVDDDRKRAREARHRGRSIGWTFKDGEDYCPDCSARDNA